MTPDLAAPSALDAAVATYIAADTNDRVEGGGAGDGGTLVAAQGVGLTPEVAPEVAPSAFRENPAWRNAESTAPGPVFGSASPWEAFARNIETPLRESREGINRGEKLRPSTPGASGGEQEQSPIGGPTRESPAVSPVGRGGKTGVEGASRPAGGVSKRRQKRRPGPSGVAGILKRLREEGA